MIHVLQLVTQIKDCRNTLADDCQKTLLCPIGLEMPAQAPLKTRSSPCSSSLGRGIVLWRNVDRLSRCDPLLPDNGVHFCSCSTMLAFFVCCLIFGCLFFSFVHLLQTPACFCLLLFALECCCILCTALRTFACSSTLSIPRFAFWLLSVAIHFGFLFLRTALSLFCK